MNGRWNWREGAGLVAGKAPSLLGAGEREDPREGLVWSLRQDSDSST